MSRRFNVLFVALLIVAPAAAASAEKRISIDRLKDHIMGGWVGQGVGVSYGAPYEFKTCGKIVEGDLAPWTPEQIKNSIGQDDLYVDMTFVAALEAHGPEITMQQAGEAFGATQYNLWHANKAGRDNIRKGIMPPLSGHPKYNLHADDIDFEIECDGIGMVCPGLPRMSNDLCDVFGHVMNYGDGVYAGMWIAGMYGQAFFERDVEKIVTRALDCVPPASKFARVIGDVIAWHKQYPSDWKKAWQEVERKYQDDIDCAPGKVFNIDATINSAYVAIALLYGGGDMGKTMEIAVRCGQDNDCNPATACGILGCMHGISGIDERYKSYLPQLKDVKFSYTDYSYSTITDACVRVARRVIEKAGGKFVTEGGVEYAIIPDQDPLPPLTLEQWPTESKKRALGIER